MKKDKSFKLIDVDKTLSFTLVKVIAIAVIAAIGLYLAGVI